MQPLRHSRRTTTLALTRASATGVGCSAELYGRLARIIHEAPRNDTVGGLASCLRCDHRDARAFDASTGVPDEA